MSSHILLNLLNKFPIKEIKCKALPSISSLLQLQCSLINLIIQEHKF